MPPNSVELPVGPPCPHCKVRTSFMGVQQSIYQELCVEVYMCPQHFVRFEANIKCNRGDKNDYKNGCETY